MYSAKIFNIYPQKGAVLPGSDADVIILNPNAETRISAKTHHSRIDTNIYEGWVMKASTFLHQIQIFWDVYTEIIHVVWAPSSCGDSFSMFELLHLKSILEMLVICWLVIYTWKIHRGKSRSL